MKKRQNDTKQYDPRRLFIAVAVAFAMVFTLLPSADVCAEDQEPTLPAPEASQQGTEEPAVDGGEASDVDETTTENGASETTTTTVTETTTASVTTTTVNTSGKVWVRPKGNKTLSLTLCRNSDGSYFNLMKQAGQRLYEYDTLQGATAGNGYGYFTLYNRKNNHVKIVKVKLSEMSVVKVSAALDINHANEITYNGRSNIIVVANSTPVPKRISVIDANTLTIKYHTTITMPRKVKGMSKRQRRKFKGIGAIAYNEQRNCYICRMRKTHDFLFLDANFRPFKRVKAKSKLKKLLYQGLDSYNDCIMVCQSFKGKKKYDAVTVYNMKGKKIARFTMSAGSPMLELQTVFHDGNQFYAGFYCNYGARADQEQLHVIRENSVYRINNL